MGEIRLAKKGYAYKKAIEIIAYEKGKGTLPSMPKSSAMRGSIQSWKNKISNGYRPKSDETKKVFDETISKYDIYETRPFMRVEKQYHSKRVGNDIQDVIFGFANNQSDEPDDKSPDLLDFDDDDVESLYAIADELGTSNNPQKWNKKFKQMNLDVKVWNEKYLEY